MLELFSPSAEQCFPWAEVNPENNPLVVLLLAGMCAVVAASMAWLHSALD